jgi:protein O-GlcNAc transferase
MLTQSLTQRCSELLQLGLTHHQADRLAETEACYREILQQEPQDPDALHLLGVIAQQRGQYDDAIQLIGAAIRKHPVAADYHNNLANTYRLHGNPSAAIASFRRATVLDPDHLDALHSLANLLVEQNQFAEAEACFRRVLVLQPGRADVCYNLGNAKWKAGDLSAAIECYRRAIELLPTTRKLPAENYPTTPCECCFASETTSRPNTTSLCAFVSKVPQRPTHTRTSSTLYMRVQNLPQLQPVYGVDDFY